MTDRLSPIGTLTAVERARAQQIVAADPDAVLPALKAALCLDDGEQTLDLMLAVIRGGQPCSAS